MRRRTRSIKADYTAQPWRYLLLVPLLLAAITGCNAGNAKDHSDAIAKLVDDARKNLITVRGSEFQMGDFGEIYSSEKLPYTGDASAMPLHKVQLSDFSMLRYRVTNDEYNVFATEKEKLRVNDPNSQDSTLSAIAAQKNSGRFPSEVLWQDAQDYCSWLGGKLGKKMQLPTEAQWEYAARDGGKFYVFATDDGSFKEGKNVLSSDQVRQLSNDFSYPVPVGMTPPNKLGLNDFAKNGFEWVADWFGEDYYEHSAAIDPAGPTSGDRRVVRGHANDAPRPVMTMERSSRQPDGQVDGFAQLRKKYNLKASTSGATFRCVALPG